MCVWLAVLALLPILVAPQQVSGSIVLRPFIINGENAVDGQFPEVVSVQYELQHFCGGTLVTKQWVLTAAHCCEVNPEKLTVLLGSVDNTVEGGGITAEIYGALVHELYDAEKFESHDIGAIKLMDEVQLSPKIQLIPLQNLEVPAGSQGVVVGWGQTSNDIEEGSRTLQFATLEVLDRGQCQKLYDGYAQIQDNQLCAADLLGGKGHCRGDSGGPLLVDGMQVGIVSWSRKPCGKSDSPGVYTRIDVHWEWIQKTTGLLAGRSLDAPGAEASSHGGEGEEATSL